MHNYLQGSWHLVQVGTDANNNEIMEAEEMRNIPDSGGVSTVFNGDGTGYGKFDLNQTFSLNANFHWTTNERDQMLMIHMEDNMSYNAKFHAQDNRSFYLLNNDATWMGSKVWLVYTRK
ncbi:MAG TPA: hypothetical protein PL009_13935 [Flavipsychrobacter sp.]|nr:hypothetical protein [Flavipsychrobacter sp.]